MRVALSTSVMQRGQSGVGQYVIALVRALLPHASRHEFTLLVLEADIPLLGFAASRMQIQPVAERHRAPVKNILWHQVALPGLVKRMGTDVLHIPSYRRMLWRRPCTMVTTIHDLAPFRVPGKYDAMRTLYGKVACRELAKRQDRIVAVSRTAAADINEFFGVPREKIHVVPNGLDHDRFKPGSRAAARAAVCTPIGLSSPFFLYVARLEHPAKNHSGLIEAFGKFKNATGSDWKLVLAGGDWHGADVVRRLVRESRHAKDIILLGFVSNAALPDWYRAADVFVFPSHFEGFGLPPVEAMACTCPVLSSNAGALEETVGGACGTLNPTDTTQMATQLARAASDPQWLGELRLAGLRRASEFSWDACASATLGVYEAATSADSLSNRHNTGGAVSSLSSRDLQKESPRRNTMLTQEPTPHPGRERTSTR